MRIPTINRNTKKGGILNLPMNAKLKRKKTQLKKMKE
jgi:hypothetical protein